MKKHFTLTVTEENGTLTVDGHNDGFNALELLGILALKMDDIVEQVNKQTKFNRVVKTDDSTIEIIEKTEKPKKCGYWYQNYDPLGNETTLKCSLCGNTSRYNGMITRGPDKCVSCNSDMDELL